MHKAQTAIILLAGEAPTAADCAVLRALAARPGCLLAAADGGANVLAGLGLQPQIIIGDGDSIAPQLFSDVPRLELQRDKDYTDGEATLRWVLSRCSGEIYIFGGLGGEIDHELGNLLLPLYLSDDAEAAGAEAKGAEAAAGKTVAERIHFIQRGQHICYSRGFCRLQGEPGQLLSLLPLTPLRGLQLSGLEYGLENYHTQPGNSRTLRNVFSGPVAEIRHSSGWLLLVQQPGKTEKIAPSSLLI